MAKKPTPQDVDGQQGPRHRVQVVLDRLFDGNQTRLADALGVSHTLVHLVVKGSHPPSRNLMTRLAKVQGVSPSWVETGEGEPLLPPSLGTLPVASGILPGWPERHTELMTGERWPTAEAFIRPSRYWLRVEPTCPALRAAELALLTGDLLLMDANTAVWADRLDDCNGKLFGVRVRRGEQVSYTLALLRRNATGLSFDTFEEHDRQSTTSPAPHFSASSPTTDDEGIKRLPRKISKLIPASEKPAKKAKPVAAPTTPPSDVPFVRAADIAGPGIITPQDIIAVRVGLYRG